MVQVIPPKTNAGDLIGQGLGSGLAQSMQQSAQQQYQKGLLQKSLQEVKGLASQPNANAFDLASSLISSTAGIPGAERYVGQLFPLLLEQLRSGQTAQALGGAEQPNQAQQPNQSISPSQNIPNQNAETPAQEKPTPITAKTANQIDELSDQFINQIRPDLAGGSSYGNVPTFDFEAKSDLRPNEEADLRKQMNDQKILPAVQDQVINRIREDIGTKYKEQLQRFNLSTTQQNAINDKWKTFRDQAPANLKPVLSMFQSSDGSPLSRTQNDLANRYFQYAQSLPTNLTPEAMHSQAMARLQYDINRMDALKAIPSMPPIHDRNDLETYGKDLKRAYEPLIADGFIESVKEDAYMNKDVGVEEFHNIAYGDQTNKDLLNQIHDLKYPKPLFTKYGLKGRFSEDYAKDKNKYVDDLSKKLQKLGPKDDLILARAMVLDNDGTIDDFYRALQKAQQSGLNLSALQLSQLQEVQIPRDRPLWEIFSPGGTKLLMNYIRGKR